MEFKDYYKILGVERDATAEDIRKAYRKLARKYHPDVSKEKDASARMQEVNEANAVLSDAEKRAAYDQVGRGQRPGHEFRPPPDWDAGFEFSEDHLSPEDAAGFSDFFSQVFGGRGGGARFRTGGGGHAPGRDTHAKVLLDIEDAFHGATRELALRVPRFDAEGRLVLDTRTLHVKIPAGVREGQLIRLAGQGSPGMGGGGAGDLLLEVHFQAHPRYRLQGRDLRIALPVAPWEAALGGVVPVQTPLGTLSVRVPAGTQGGRELRVRGKGLPGREPGDLFLDIAVVLPPADSDRAKEIYETMKRELAFDPRAAGGAE